MFFRGLPRVEKLEDALLHYRSQDILFYDKEEKLIVLNKHTDFDTSNIFPFYDETVSVTGFENDDLWGITFLDIKESEFLRRRQAWKAAVGKVAGTVSVADRPTKGGTK